LIESLEYYLKKHNVEKREDLLKLFENFNQSSKINKPKYIYLNTLVLSKKETINRLKQDNFVRLNKSFLKSNVEENEVNNNTEDNNQQNDKSNIDLINRIKKIKNNEFVKDNHIKSLYIFSSDSLINKTYSLFQEGHLLQIDKSSCLVPYALSPPENSFVIDAASAPVNKFKIVYNYLHKIKIFIFSQTN
jgi:16S rRNA C967 or C1407 C5-methylase (RsmB/RsmF family)